MEHAVLKDSGVYKDKLLSIFLNSDNIKDILTGDAYTDEMWYGTADDDCGIIYKQIFPCLYADETQTAVKTFIGFEVDFPEIPTSTIKNVSLTIWAYCHKDILRYSREGFSGTRADILADMIERELRNSDKPGIGSMQLKSTQRIFLNNTYYGKEIIYFIPDFKFKPVARQKSKV